MSSFAPNPGQTAAIGAPFDQPVRVVAGAGTGKTEVIARRYLQLLRAGGLRPDNILVLTFSEKASAEMRARIARAVAGPSVERLDLAAAPISTFHAFCARLLSDHSLAARVDPGLSLLTEIDAQEILDLAKDAFLAGGYRAAYGAFNPLDAADYSWQAGGPFEPALEVINQLRNQGISWDEFERQAQALPAGSTGQQVLGPLIAWLYRAYLDQLSARGRLDFDRLIMDAAALLERDAPLRSALRQQYRAVLVDEYQDTNYAQERLLRVLAGARMANVTVVGDPRQAIYVWREARVENIAGFPGDGGPRFEAPLVENRRSLVPILSVANRAIAGYEFGAPAEFSAADRLAPSREHMAFSGAVVSLQASPTREAEAQSVLRLDRAGCEPTALSIATSRCSSAPAPICPPTWRRWRPLASRWRCRPAIRSTPAPKSSTRSICCVSASIRPTSLPWHVCCSARRSGSIRPRWLACAAAARAVCGRRCWPRPKPDPPATWMTRPARPVAGWWVCGRRPRPSAGASRQRHFWVGRCAAAGWPPPPTRPLSAPCASCWRSRRAMPPITRPRD